MHKRAVSVNCVHATHMLPRQFTTDTKPVVSLLSFNVHHCSCYSCKLYTVEKPVELHMICLCFLAAARCDDFGTPGGMKQVATSYEAGQTVKLECLRPGYSVIGGSSTRSCLVSNSNTYWDDNSQVTCQGMYCSYFAIRLGFPSLEWLQINKSVLCNLAKI